MARGAWGRRSPTRPATGSCAEEAPTPAALADAPGPGLPDIEGGAGAAKPPRITLARTMISIAGVAVASAMMREFGWSPEGIFQLVLFFAVPVSGLALFLTKVAIPFALKIRPIPTGPTPHRSRLQRAWRKGLFWFAKVGVSGALFVIVYWFVVYVILSVLMALNPVD